MLDNSKKTEPPLAALRATVSFEVELMPALIEHLEAENIATPNDTPHIVSDVSYAGDEGGIVCHIVPPDRQEALIVSLTQVLCPSHDATLHRQSLTIRSIELRSLKSRDIS
jgi:hypothetical protein